MSIKTLLVDDETSLLNEGKKFLERINEEIEVLTVSSAERALEMIDEKDIDVIVSDYMMPDIDGLEFLEELREERDSDIPFIIFTGKGEEEVAMKALNLGVCRYIKKGNDPKSQYGVLADAIVQEYGYWKARRELERSEVKSRQKYEKMFHETPLGAFHYDKKGIITECNDRFVEIIGSSREDLIGLDMLNDLENDELVEEVRSSLEGSKGYYEGEYTSVTGGKTTNVRVFLKGIEDEDGQISSGMGLVEDNTEREEYEHELKRKETYLDYTPTFIAVIDEEGEMKYHSYPSDEETGLESREIVGMDAIEYAHPDDKEDVLKMFSEVMENPGEEYRTELRAESEDGWRWLEIRAVNYLGDPNINGIIVTSQDISKRKEAEEELKKSEKKFRTVIENSADAIYLTDQEGNFLYTNEAGSDLLGYTKEELLDMKMTEPAKNPERLLEHFEKLFEEDRVTAEFTYIRKDGAEIAVDINAVLLPDGRIYGSSRDVTERKEMEEKLKKSEKKFRTIIEGSADAIFLTDQEGNYTYANEAATELLGYPREEFMEMNIADLAPEEKMEEHRKLFEKLLEEEKIHTEISFVKKDGTEVPIDINAVMLPTGEIYGSCRDMTERKEMEEKLKKSEKKFRTIIENSADAIFITDQEGNYTYANQAASELLGYSREEITEMNIADLAPEERLEEYQKTFQNIVEEEKIHTEMTLIDKDGTKIPVDLNAVLLPNGRIYGSCRDISERKEAEEELKKKEEKYRNIFEQFQDLYYKADAEGNIKELSPSVEPLSGYTRDELIGEPVSKVYSDPEERAELLNELLENGKVKDYEIKLEKKSGEIAIVSINSQLIKDEDGDIKEVEGTIRDITERKEAEEKLRESEQRLDLALKGAELGVWDWKVKTDEVKYSEQWAEMLGYSHDEIEQDLASWEERLHPDERPRVKDELEKHLEGETELYKTEHRMKTKSGDWIWVKDVGKCLKRDENGEPVRATGILEDITDRKEFEKKLRESEKRYKQLSEELENILDHIPGLVYYKDTENNLIKVNKRLAEAHDMSKEEMEGKSLFDLYPEEEAQDYLEDDKEVIENREPKLNMIEPWSPDEERWMSTSKIPYIVDGEIRGIIGISIDVTEERKNRQRVELLHTILRHDIKNKAQAVQGYLQLLEEEEKEFSKDSQELVEGALTANKESVNLIQKVRLLLDAQEEEIKPVEIVSTIKDTVESNKPMAESEGIDLLMECPSTECKVEGGSLLREVFQNLIENSINHSEGSRIKIVGEVKDDEVVCSIEDDGKGIPDDKKDIVFEKGYTTDEERGTGLGLFLVKNLLESYGGSIEVEDSDMGGTRFIVHLEKVES